MGEIDRRYPYFNSILADMVIGEFVYG